MVKATINNFEAFSLLGKSLGKIEYVSRRSVGRDMDTDVALVNLNGTFDQLKIQPQAGFDFSLPVGTPLKLVNAQLVATEARNNRNFSTVQGIKGTLVPLDASTPNEFSEDEYDMVFVTGKDRRPVGMVRSKDGFSIRDLMIVGFEPIYKTDYRNQLVRDDDQETIITGYGVDFIQDGVADGDVGRLVRIVVSKDEFEKLKPDLKLRDKYVPQGLKIAFVGNETTNWTIYADTLVPLSIVNDDVNSTNNKKSQNVKNTDGTSKSSELKNDKD
ncbi:hypothetical protein K1728_05285 [Weissella confusa]|uniref:hypothetical protein n=1 Tax=Weissella confusa TaxID=1583 RepID=UPI001C6FB59C|nr:hypothetical protein [Weissella confusa]QYU58813.1 hypothetical protein K1728_05285 [Weissella confusa]